MIAGKIYFKGYKCFKKEWVGFEEIKPINVIIGKNNTGKSHLLDYVGFLCNEFPEEGDYSYKIELLLEENLVKQIFSKDVRDFDLSGNHWDNHGKYFVGKTATIEFNSIKGKINTYFTEDIECANISRSEIDNRLNRISNFLESRIKNNRTRKIENELKDKKFRRLLADRNIRPEASQKILSLSADGSGASNIIRKYLNTSDLSYTKRLVTVELLDALNLIFGNENRFSDIDIYEHDKEDHINPWEIFLGSNGNMIPLSSSGSGLKTIILLLLNLLVIPEIESTKKSDYVFAFEELENNLHPAIFKRLLKYLEDFVIRERCTIFLTTHSSVALDFFSSAENVQFLHVTHDGESAKVTPVAAHFDKLNVINDLGTKPSDLLQANGIIWVEGPSDRIYVNRWIQLLTDGKYREGRHYQCAFYGGSLLAHLEASSPDESNEDFVNLITINPNIIVICDSDKKSETDTNKPRVERIMEQINASGAKRDCIVTQCKEVENYLTGAVIKRAFGDSSSSEMPPDPEQYQSIFDESGEEASYWERITGKKSCEKFKIASRCAAVMEMGDLERFGLKDDIRRIVRKIEKWNR